MVLGAGGEVGGFALDLTGIGAVAGVPIGVVSAGVIVVGATVASTGMLAMAETGGDISRDAQSHYQRLIGNMRGSSVAGPRGSKP